MTEPSSTIRVRIAPSPTGDPHVGTAYIGLLNFIYAKQRGGTFVLRIEDTDRTRFVPTSEQMIFDSLRWLGLRWDEGPDVGGPYGPYRQSERTEIYREHVAMLLASGHAYRSFETAEELEAMRKSQLAAKLPPRYNGAHRELPAAQIAQYEAEGRPYVVRLKVPMEGETTFRDELRDAVTFSHNNVDDQVLMKSDGFPTYHLANVVDDHLMRITDVIRAEEWISSTPKHVLLYKAFGWAVPRFWHMPLLRNLDKSKISKRKNPVSLVYYRDSGYLPQALLNFLGLMGGGMPAGGLGTGDDKAANLAAEIFTLPQMLERFVFEKISLGGPVFDLTKLKWLNGEYIRALSPNDFLFQLREVLFSETVLRQIGPLVQTRIETLSQFGNMVGFLFADNINPSPEVLAQFDKDATEILRFSEELLNTLEKCDWDDAAIEWAVLSVGATTLLTKYPETQKSETRRETYRLAVRKLFQMVHSEMENGKRFRLGMADERTLTKFKEWLGSDTLQNLDFINAVRDLSDYIRTEKGEWSVSESFMLLRAIITGSKTSPPLLDCLRVFGKSRSLDRLRLFINTQKKQAMARKSEPSRPVLESHGRKFLED